jgi:hypothetical protein
MPDNSQLTIFFQIVAGNASLTDKCTEHTQNRILQVTRTTSRDILEEQCGRQVGALPYRILYIT